MIYKTILRMVLPVFLLLGLTACSIKTESTQISQVTQTVVTTTEPNAQQPDPTVAPALWFSPNLPETFTGSIKSVEPYSITNSAESATIRIEPGTEGIILAQWKYVLVAPFPQIADSVSSEWLLNFWQTGSTSDEQNAAKILVVDEDTSAFLAAFWGVPSPEAVKVLSTNQLLSTAWADPAYSTWSLLPFEQLQKEWKVISIDQEDPFSIDSTFLTFPIAASGEITFSEPIQQNFQPDRLTTLNITGVTALVRATAAMMERNGIPYPAEEIGSYLRESDFTHISNEVSFATDCPAPVYEMDDLVFCSSPEYIELLDFIGTDIVEMTGDHLEDWGIEPIYTTLQMYIEKGWLVYGAGTNLTDAQQPLLIEHNGNRLMLIGCNAKSTAYAHAAENYPGTWYCDDYSAIIAAIKDAVAMQYIPIVTIQHTEIDQMLPTSQIIEDFQLLSDGGAQIIIGSQAHQPSTIQLNNQSFIHYGLGNLFFDQYNESPENRQAFIDHFVFYENRLISIQLQTTQFVDWAKPRWMTEDERNVFLTTIFQNSAWDVEFP